MTVEIDESKFGKTKYNCGRYIEGQWVFNGICRQSKACFLVPVAQRNKDTLLPIIRAHMLPGTHVMSGMWKAYDCLKDEGYGHLTVNHSLNFVDPDTGAHTQRIENTWWGVKRSMPRTGTSKDLFESYLQEWMWRKHYGDDPFGNIVKHIADLYEVRKDAYMVLCTIVCTGRDLIANCYFIEEKNRIHSFIVWEFEEANQAEGTCTDTRGKQQFYFTLFYFLNYYNSSWPAQHFIANRKQPSLLRPKILNYFSSIFKLAHRLKSLLFGAGFACAQLKNTVNLSQIIFSFCFL